MPHSPTLTIHTTCTGWDDDTTTFEEVTKFQIDIDEEGEWDMPPGLSEAEQRNVTAWMEVYLRDRWSADDYGVQDEDYYEEGRRLA